LADLDHDTTRALSKLKAVASPGNAAAFAIGHRSDTEQYLQIICRLARKRSLRRKRFRVHAIDIENTVEVVDLMLNNPRRPAL
jgi:hypothetical protein